MLRHRPSPPSLRIIASFGKHNCFNLTVKRLSYDFGGSSAKLEPLPGVRAPEQWRGMDRENAGRDLFEISDRVRV